MNKKLFEAKSPLAIKAHFVEFTQELDFQNTVIGVTGSIDQMQPEDIVVAWKQTNENPAFFDWLKGHRPDLEADIQEIQDYTGTDIEPSSGA